MNLYAQLMRLVERCYKPERDPGRVKRIYHIYDVDRGYQHYHLLCQQRLKRPVADQPTTPLHERGFAYLDVITPSAAAIIRAVCASGPPARIKKNSRPLKGYRLTDRQLIEGILKQVFTTALDEQLVNFFRSEYLVHWLTFAATTPAAAQDIVSFRWHCDKGPSQHLKLIIYLNASGEHGGNTEFITLADTQDVGACGYVFGWTRRRTSEVRYLEQLAGHPIKTHRQAMEAGQGVLFQPANVLHRGVSPSRGERYALTLNLLPSPVPWQTALHRGALSDLTKEANWHSHADVLLQTPHLQAGQS